MFKAIRARPVRVIARLERKARDRMAIIEGLRAERERLRIAVEISEQQQMPRPQQQVSASTASVASAASAASAASSSARTVIDLALSPNISSDKLAFHSQNSPVTPYHLATLRDKVTPYRDHQGKGKAPL